MKELGKLILVQMYHRLGNNTSQVSEGDLYYQVQNVYGNLTNFTQELSEEDYNAALNELLRKNSVRRRKKRGWISYQFTPKGKGQAENLIKQLKRRKRLQREPVSQPLAAYRALEPNPYRNIAVIAFIAILGLVIWYWLSNQQ